MKKIVALGAIAALACGMVFADEPAIDTKVAELSGNAEVKWGVDLDAGQHGFSHSGDQKLKINISNEGTKESEGDGIWADIQVKGKGVNIENGAVKDGTASVERAKIHINDFYIDIKSGHTQVGEFKPDTAVHSDFAVLKSAGIDFENGIQAGYDAEAFKFSLDFRSYKAAKTNYTSSYGIAFNAGLKDNLVPGLTVDAGVAYNLSPEYVQCADPAIEATVTADNASLANHAAAIPEWDADKGKVSNAGAFGAATKKDFHRLAYGFKAAYKLAIGDDGLYVKPSAGIAGTYETYNQAVGKDWKAGTDSSMAVAVGALFGWGDINKDAKAGVPYLDVDGSKKVSPGVGVVAYIPLASVSTFNETKTTTYDKLKALIVPSFYLGEDKVSGLKAAAYGEIGIYNFQKPEDKYKAASTGTQVLESASDDFKTKVFKGIVKENETTAIAFAAGLSYGLTLDNDWTVTPKAGFRYANGAYVSNNTSAYANTGIFDKLGMQNTFIEGSDVGKKTYAGDFFNLSAGVELGGAINNTTFSANYTSANLSNAISDDAAKSTPAYAKDTKYYNVKLGTFDIGCKISL